MSISELKTICCPKCTGQNKVVIYQSITPNEDMSLRRDLLNESIFLYKCTHCHYNAKLSYPVLYNDTKNRFLIYLIPNSEKQHITDRVLEKENSNVSPVDKRIVSTFNELKEKIILFEAGLDDMAIELTKIALRVEIKNNDKIDVLDAHFSIYDKNQIGFTFFEKDTNTPIIKTTDLKVYKASKTIVKRLAKKELLANGFIRIDRLWGQEILYKYQKYGFEANN